MTTLTISTTSSAVVRHPLLQGSTADMYCPIDQCWYQVIVSHKLDAYPVKTVEKPKARDLKPYPAFDEIADHYDYGLNGSELFELSENLDYSPEQRLELEDKAFAEWETETLISMGR